ncbi:hypothetical protein HRED_01806, partial [Candidatus Haloredivivus sp. G17]
GSNPGLRDFHFGAILGQIGYESCAPRSSQIKRMLEQLWGSKTVFCDIFLYKYA